MPSFLDNAIPASPLDAALYLEGVTGPAADLARSIYAQESSSGRNTRTSNAGAMGGMQILPGTFKEVADKGWDINDPIHNARGGVRYLNKMLAAAGGDPRLAAMGYYGGPRAIDAARKGRARRDPRNPNAPDTFQYADSVMARIGNRVTDALIPSAQAAEVQDMPQQLPAWMRDAIPVDDAQPQEDQADNAYRVKITGTADSKPGRMESFAAGLGHGVGSLALGGQQLLGHGLRGVGLDSAGNWLIDDAQEGLQRIGGQVQPYKDAHSFVTGAGDLTGQIGVTLPALPVAAASRAGLLGRTAVGAAEGGVLSALNPTEEGDNFASDKAKQTALGAGLGGVLAPVAAGISRVVSPKASQAGSQARLLQKEGVELTPGQAAGGALLATEDKLMSTPFLGDAIRASRRRGNEQFNRAVYNRVLEPIGGKTTKTGRAAVDDVSGQVSKAYDDLLAKVEFRPDDKFAQDIDRLWDLVVDGLPEKEARSFLNTMRREVLDPISQGQAVPGVTFKKMESQLGQQAQKFHSSTDAYQRQAGDAIQQLQALLREGLERSNPKHAEQLRKVNQAYARLTRLQEAAGGIGATDGVFTPAQFSSAVRKGDRSVRKNRYAKGEAVMQDLADAGRSRMMSAIPNSGTTDRAMLGALGYGIGAGAINPALLAPYALATAASLPRVSGLLARGITMRPQMAHRVAPLLRNAPVGLLAGYGAAQ